jgi:anti-sigma factor RsiW
MNCDDASELLTAYIDDELDLATALRIEQHLSGCPECRRQVAAAGAINAALSQPGVAYAAPPVLRQRLKTVIRSETPGQPSGRAWRRPALAGLAAAIVLAIGAALLFQQHDARSSQLAVLLDAHLRSLQADHLLDVESTDRHTVAPWFSGKLNFAPPVVDLSAEGYPLVGGRLEYLQQRPVAALVYHRNKHIINVLIEPGPTTPAVESRQGYHLIRFACRGMTCWAVSDLNLEDLQAFVRRFAEQHPTSEPS